MPKTQPLPAEETPRADLVGEVGLSRLRRQIASLRPGRGCWHCQGECYKQFAGQEAVAVQWRHLLLSLPSEEQDTELGIMFNCRGGSWEHLLPMIKTMPGNRPRVKHDTNMSTLPDNRPKVKQDPKLKAKRMLKNKEHLSALNQVPDIKDTDLPWGYMETTDESESDSNSRSTMPSACDTSDGDASWSNSRDTEPNECETSSDQISEFSSETGMSDIESGTTFNKQMQIWPQPQRKRGPLGRSRRSKMSFAFLGKQVCKDLSSQSTMKHCLNHKSHVKAAACEFLIQGVMAARRLVGVGAGRLQRIKRGEKDMRKRPRPRGPYGLPLELHGAGRSALTFLWTVYHQTAGGLPDKLKFTAEESWSKAGSQCGVSRCFHDCNAAVSGLGARQKAFAGQARAS